MPDYTVSQDIDDFMQSADDAAARTELGLGSAATSNTTDFAAASHNHSTGDITGLSTAITTNTDVAANTAARHTHTNKAILDATTASFTTTDQNTLNSALQSGDNITELANNAGYITSAPVDSVNGDTGSVVLDADDIDDASTTNKFATQAQLDNADSALQSGDNITELANNAGYITSAPVDSVNGNTGTVLLDADDIDDSLTTHKFATQAQLDNADSALQSGDIDTLAELNAILTDANLDDASSARPPTTHAHAAWYVTKMGTEADDTSGTGEKTAWIAPASGEITGVHSGCSTATAGGSLTVDVKKNGTTILSTLGVIASGDDSTTTGTAHVLTTNPTTFAAGDRLSFEVNAFGGTGAKGLHTDLLIEWD